MPPRVLADIVLADVLADIKRLAVTFALALGCGWGFLRLGIPAPFLMGSLFGVWLSGGIARRLRPQADITRYLGVARWFHVPVVLGLGVLIGGNFTPDLLTTASQWGVTIAAMVITTILAAGVLFAYLHHHKGYDPQLALFCSVPGGQAEALAMARQMISHDYVVALFHLIRVTVVFLSTPLLLAVIEGHEAVITSNDRLTHMPGLGDLPPLDLVLFAALALAGYAIARIIRLPMPHLLGPMGLSTIAHLSGWLELPRIGEFVILAQVTIGGGIGARLASVSVREVVRILKDAVIASGMILILYLLAAFMLAAMTGESFLSLWLAFVPGGLYEVTLLALIFGFDVAFVAVHHTIRVVLIFLTMPMIAVRLGKRPSPRP